MSVLAAVGIATSTSLACGCADRRHAHLARLGRLHAQEADRARGRAISQRAAAALTGLFLTSGGVWHRPDGVSRLAGRGSVLDESSRLSADAQALGRTSHALASAARD